ncbi:hypothetical protein MMC25_007528 [Agyrium rufum]|nr:hypothetical protein [Agyrium rufum]
MPSPKEYVLVQPRADYDGSHPQRFVILFSSPSPLQHFLDASAVWTLKPLAEAGCLCAPAYSLGENDSLVTSTTNGSTAASSYSSIPPLATQDRYRTQKSSGRGTLSSETSSIGTSIGTSIGKNGISKRRPTGPARTLSASGIKLLDLAYQNDEDHNASQSPSVSPKFESFQDNNPGGGNLAPDAVAQIEIHQHSSAPIHEHEDKVLPLSFDTAPSITLQAQHHEAPIKSCCQKKNHVQAMQTSTGTSHPASQSVFSSPPIGDFSIFPPPMVDVFGTLPTSNILDKGQWWEEPFSPSSTYAIPPNYATASHPGKPLDFHPLQHIHSHHLLHHQAPDPRQQHHTHSITTPLASYQNINTAAEAYTNPEHICSCGAGCACLACPVHPFNATTRDRVQDLGHVLDDGTDASQSQSPPQHIHSPPFHAHPDLSMTISKEGGSIHINSAQLQPHPSDFIPLLESSSRHFGPHDISQPENPLDQIFPPYPEDIHAAYQNDDDEQSHGIFSSSSYYTFEFPIEQSGLLFDCTDTSGTCQCGSDCACVGCLTHTGHDRNELVNGDVDFESANDLVDGGEHVNLQEKSELKQDDPVAQCGSNEPMKSQGEGGLESQMTAEEDAERPRRHCCH